jgi:hypothetical protein
MDDIFNTGMLVAIVRASDNVTLATAEVVKINDDQMSTETEYAQHSGAEVPFARRYWSASGDREKRIPRDEKATRTVCFVRPATTDDVTSAQQRVDARWAKGRRAGNESNKAYYAGEIARHRKALASVEEPYVKLVAQMERDELLIASVVP